MKKILLPITDWAKALANMWKVYPDTETRERIREKERRELKAKEKKNGIQN